ncbi:glycosyltransferase [uncultured Treponema sp.]|uniref:glycosyltransferase n=1 Tax=uncultured Treponema sp. TaxID=162155 RepID=UPI0025E2B4B0|nr:glycosyltransferase [uncultured Treponema sp.]
MKRVAIVHDWLVNYGGAERVVEELLKIYPEAEIFTLVYDEKKMGKIFPKEKVHTSFMQKWPFSTKLYTKFLSFMPKAFESFDLSYYKLVICSSSSCAKGVITSPLTPHVAYIHTPMRYAWDKYFDYKTRSGRITQFFMDKWMPKIRLWDYISSQRVDTLIANSNYISRRIKKYWNRESTVIYPPVNTDKLFPNYKPHEDFFVVFSRFVPYKRIDLAIQACGNLKKNLVVIGSGSQEKSLKKLASSYKDSKITFTGRISDKEVMDYLQRCRALIFCAEEDFGIIPVEAQCCGRPVIAFGKGGALETVINGKTGTFFSHATVDSVERAINRFEELEKDGAFDTNFIYQHAKKFSAERFAREIKECIDNTLIKLDEETSQN